MSKQLKDYLHLYLGCDIQVRYKQHFKEAAEKSVSINPEYVEKLFEEYKIETLDKMTLFLYNPDYVKPLLHHLSAISKDQVAELLDIDVDAVIIQGNFCSPFFQIEYVDKEGENTYEYRYLTQLSPDQVVYLLSKHFDLFGLIEAGLAIDNTKVA